MVKIMIFSNRNTFSYLVVGLGNPGKQYANTRHNVGFDCIDKCAKEYGIKINKSGMHSLYGTGKIGETKVVFAKPQTYMNLSGTALVELMSYYKLPIDKVIVMCDDISLDTGKIRIRTHGSSGGHNGLKNIEGMTGSQDYKRIKLGVGERENKEEDLKDWVLGHFTDEERKLIDDCTDKACKALKLMVQDETEKAMNLYNG